MKYFKYAFVSILTIFCLPNIVKAEKIYKNFEVGDKVTINLQIKGSSKEQFYVIADDKKDNTVTALYETTIGEAVPYGRYSQINPIGSLPNTVDYNTSSAKIELEKYFQEKNWNAYRELRLLNEGDITNIKKGNKNTLPSWLSLNKEYWMGYALQETPDKEQTATPAGDKITVDRTPQPPTGTIIDSKNQIATKLITEKAYLRPVIVIPKDYIEGGYTESDSSNDDKTDDSQTPPNPDSTQKPDDTQTDIKKPTQTGDTKVENPKTGVYVSFGILVGGIILGVTYLVLKKKKYFRKL